MVRRSVPQDKPPSSPQARLSRPATPSRVDRLVQVIDQCSAAKQTADEMGDKLLSYLLSMAIQEARALARNPNPPTKN